MKALLLQALYLISQRLMHRYPIVYLAQKVYSGLVVAMSVILITEQVSEALLWEDYIISVMGIIFFD